MKGKQDILVKIPSGKLFQFTKITSKLVFLEDDFSKSTEKTSIPFPFKLNGI